MKLRKVLNAIDVVIESEAIREGYIIYFCKTPHLDGQFFGSHMMIVDSKNSEDKSLCSNPMRIKDKTKALEIINDLNQELSYGCVTVSDNGDVCYSCGLYLADGMNFDFAASMAAKIILNYEYNIPIIWDKLNAAGLIVSIANGKYKVN